MDGFLILVLTSSGARELKVTYEGCCEMSHLVSGRRHKSSKSKKNLAEIHLSIKYLINLSVQNIKKVTEEYTRILI